MNRQTPYCESSRKLVMKKNFWTQISWVFTMFQRNMQIF